MADWEADSARLQANLASVLDSIVEAAASRRKITLPTIKQWHRQTMAGPTVPSPVMIGRFRGEAGLESCRVRVGRHEGTAPQRVRADLDNFIVKLQAALYTLDKTAPADGTLDADELNAVLEISAWAHAEWVRIHPFANGNGRTARLLANAILLRYGLPPAVRTRPRPGNPYGAAGEAPMRGDYKPMVTILRRMLRAMMQ